MIVDSKCLGCASYKLDCDGTEKGMTWDLPCFTEPKTCHHETNLEQGDCIKCEGGD